MPRRRESEPIAEQNREDAAQRADQARRDAEGPCFDVSPCAYLREGSICTFCYHLGRRARTSAELEAIAELERDEAWRQTGLLKDREWTSPEPEAAPDERI